MTVEWLTGDVLDHVRHLDTNTVDLAACSPPFLALRNYNDLPGQWGSEATPADFLDNLLTLATELRRVITPTGSIAIELGDTFAGSGGAGGDYSDGGMREGQNAFTGSARRDRVEIPRQNSGGTGWPLSKSLTGVPTLFAWSLAYGRNLLNPDHTFEPWRVRNVIVWARPNPAPGALADKVRPATSYITVACPSAKRWFDLDAVRHPHTKINGDRRMYTDPLSRNDGDASTERYSSAHPAGAPPTDFWSDEYDGDITWLVNTVGSGLAHYAMWPATLAERLVLSMCPPEVCRQCGEPRRRLTEQTPEYAAHRQRSSEAGTNMRAERERLGMGHGGRGSERMDSKMITSGWSDCGHGDNWRPGKVLDPFSGTGTTLAVADIHGRDAIGIDLDPGNKQLYEHRYEEVWRALKPGPSPVTTHGTQLDLAL